MKTIIMACTGISCLVLWSVSAAALESPYARFLDSSRDQIVRRVVVPSVDQPQGEVQLIRRGKLLVVQTLLVSRVLKRLVAVIDSKEKRSWPEGREGSIASNRYREELFRATEKSWEAFRQRTDRKQSRQTLLIEFILTPKESLIALSLPQISGEYGNLSLLDKLPVKVWRVPGNYVRENALEIISNSFHVDAAAADELLREGSAKEIKE